VNNSIGSEISQRSEISLDTGTQVHDRGITSSSFIKGAMVAEVSFTKVS